MASDKTPSTIQTSFAGGEVSPSLFGRVDLAKFSVGASTMRNFFGNYRGGASSRAGLAYVGTSKQDGESYAPRLITFQLSINEGFALEFGHLYMRVIRDGAYVTEANKNVVSATNTDPLVVEVTAHGYSNGDWVYAANWGGMTELNGLMWIVRNPSTDTFELEDMFGNAVDAADFGVYTSGGTVARIYTAVSPYSAVDLPWLKFAQNKDEMSLCCVNQETGTEYAPYDLTRVSDSNWTFTATSFGSSISAPTGAYAIAQSSTTKSTYYSYVVTAVDLETGEESIASNPANIFNNDISIAAGSNTINWTAVAGASSYNVYKATPSYSVPVSIGVSYGYVGNAFGTSFTDTNIIADFSEVPPQHKNPFARGQITAVAVSASTGGLSQNTIGYSITTSTGSGFSGTPIVTNGIVSAFYIANNGSGYAGSDTMAIGVRASGTYNFNSGVTANNETIILNGQTWTFTTSAAGANQTTIRATLAETVQALMVDLNASATAAISAATYSLDNTGLILNITYDAIGTGGNAYTIAAGTYGGAPSGGTLTGGTASVATATLTVGAATGTYPGVVSYYQQRRVYAATTNNPDTYFFSQPGAYTNFDSSVPINDSDAIIGAPWAQQVNGIQGLQPMTNGLVILTGNGAWLLNGGADSVLTPSNQTATSQAYNGCHNHMPPVVVNYDILYVQAKGSIVRDLAYNFFSNVFTGTDMTILSNHLFNYHQMEQWAYCEEPYKLVWLIRDDGAMLSLTYLKEQDVYTWTHHDTNGFFVSACSVTEPPVDAPYVVVQRYVNEQWKYYIERMDNRNWTNAEDCFCVDAGLEYPMSFPAATLQPAAAEGTGNISSVTLISGGSGYTSPTAIVVPNDGSPGSGCTLTVVHSGGIITGITVDTEGTGYISGECSVVISDDDGTGASAQPVVTNYVTFTASASVFASGNVGDIIRIGNADAAIVTTGLAVTGGGKAEIVEYVSGTEVVANIIEPITALIPNDPDNRPVPADANQWSLSTPTTTVSALNHLEGMQVAIVADGGVLPNQTVTDGAVTLPVAASAIAVGLPYTCQLQTLYLDPPSENPTVQGRRKTITQVAVRMNNSRGVSVGTNQPDQSTQPDNALVPWTNMQAVKERNALIDAGSAIPLFTGDSIVNPISGWSEYAQVAVEQANPMPADITALILTYCVGDE